MATGDNGGEGEQEGKRVKMCPFLGEYCIVERCALYTEVVENMGGLQRKSGMCAYHVFGTILSQINTKTVVPPQVQQKIQLPGIRRG